MPYATLQSRADTAAANGHIQAPGYLFNEAADGFTGFTFDVTTYPGLAAMNDKNIDASVPSSRRPSRSTPDCSTAARHGPRDGPERNLARPVRGVRGVRRRSPSFSYSVHSLPVRHQRLGDHADPRRVRGPADRRRPTSFVPRSSPTRPRPTALQNLAANQTTWENLYLAGLEQAGDAAARRRHARRSAKTR